jgi:hypothetical protein
MSPETEPILLTDRSGDATFDTCPMSFWLNRKQDGIGIVPVNEPIYFLIGRQTHEDLAFIAEATDIRDGALEEYCQEILKGISEEDKKDTPKMEMLYRRMGWMVAWALYLEPRIRERYENVGIEKEIILDRTPLWVPVTPDRVLRDRSSKRLEYREYKTTVSASQKWLRSWFFAIQLHIGLAAIQEELEQPVSFAHIVGLMKGDKDEQGRLGHPYVWGYYNTESHEWGWEYQKCKASSWLKMPVWEFEGGIVKWVRMLGEEVAKKQFPHSPPVPCNNRMLEEWVSSRIHRYRHIRAVEASCRSNEQALLDHFPRHQGKCNPAFGDPCAYLHACWNAETNADPIGSGLYVKRVPHHDVETVGVENEN